MYTARRQSRNQGCSVFRPLVGRVDRVSTQEEKKNKRVQVRWWHILLIAFFVVLFLFLAYWQWTRFRSGSGTFQNLGYAFQWPLFAVFVVYAYRTTLRYENERLAAEEEARDMDSTTTEAPAESPAPPQADTKIDEDFLPQRPQIDVETFNAMNTPRRRRGENEES